MDGSRNFPDALLLLLPDGLENGRQLASIVMREQCLKRREEVDGVLGGMRHDELSNSLCFLFR
jgi:hypothetical protein